MSLDLNEDSDETRYAATCDTSNHARYAIMEGRNSQGAKLWLVAFSRAGHALRMSFPHARYGGEQAALAVAIACRDAALAAMKPMTNREMRTIVRRNRTEGMPGVYFSKASGQRGASWLAVITLPGGRSRRRYFSVERHGDAAARQLAEEARERLLDEVDNIDDAALRSSGARALELNQPTEPPLSEPDPKAAVRESGRRGASWRAATVFGGRVMHQRFADADFGGETASLAVALAWRAAVSTLAASDPTSPLASSTAVKPRPRVGGKTAPTGVYLRPAKAGRSADWQARTVLPTGRIKVRSFSVSRHGEDAARLLAEAERAEMLAAEAESLVGPPKRRRGD